jgi:alkanesulfonate monooxygenase SsuD/methylene tetrahydromethanopterin reductase-like flavin-dependent oxidoreductase (luciferase family)
MRIGLSVNQDGIPYQKLKSIALTAEKNGLDSFWLLDHFHASPRPDEKEMLECWTFLSAIAAETKQIRIGALVLNINNRNPALTAKMTATLDQISDGRFEFGIGAGGTNRAKRQKNLGYQYEFDAYGIHFPMKPSKRIEKLNEGLEIMKRMWTQKTATFKGHHYSVLDAICLPKTVQNPYPPIWIGGRGGPKLIKVIAKHANGWHISGISTVKEYVEKIEVLEKACLAQGRGISEIETSVTIRGSITEVKGKLEVFKKQGLDLAILQSPPGKEEKYIRHFGSSEF